MNPLRVRIFDIDTHKVETSFLDMCFTSRGYVECAYWIFEKSSNMLIELCWDFSDNISEN